MGRVFAGGAEVGSHDVRCGVATADAGDFPWKCEKGAKMRTGAEERRGREFTAEESLDELRSVVGSGLEEAAKDVALRTGGNFLSTKA